MERKCKRCQKRFIPSIWNQVYCGSKTNKVGCSYWNININRTKRRLRDEKYREYQKNYQREWRKMQRARNTDYAKRQKELKKNDYHKNKTIHRERHKKWVVENLDRVLFSNRQRIKMLRQVKGNHTYEKWLELKRRYNYRCAVCGISEEELSKKWEGTSFTKLTEDHIIPISQRGTNNIGNIQPLCISCNASKKDKLWRKREKNK